MLLETAVPLWGVYVAALLVFVLALGFVLLFGSSRPHS